MVPEATTPFDWREVEDVNIHGVWISRQSWSLGAIGNVSSWGLQSSSSMDQGDLPGDLPLETEMGSFLIPTSDSGGDSVHGLDALHDSYQDPGWVVTDQSCGVFGLIIFSMDNIQFELVGISLELLPSGDVSGSKPAHSFLLDVGVSKGFLEICFESSKGPKGLVGKPLLASDFGPGSGQSFLHVW